MNAWLAGVLGIGVFALLFSFWLQLKINGMEAGSEKMRKLAGAIQTGAMAYLKTQYSILAIFAVVMATALATFLDNGIVTANMSPAEFVPTQQVQYQWPKWGQYYETGGKAGDAIDMPAGQELFDLFRRWQTASSEDQRREIWERILEINADETFTIGIVCCTKQPVVVTNTLKNVPEEAIYAWDPGAHFGIYLPDTFYFDDARN